MDIKDLILLVIACEALTQISNKAVIFDKPRNWLMNNSIFLDALLRCPYCQSVWVSICLTICYFVLPISRYFVIMLVIHRLSNHLHLVFSLMRDRQLDIRIGRNKGKNSN